MKRVKRTRSSSSVKRSSSSHKPSISSSVVSHLHVPLVSQSIGYSGSVRQFSRESSSGDGKPKKASVTATKRRLKASFTDNDTTFEVSPGIQIAVEGIPESVIASHNLKPPAESTPDIPSPPPVEKAKRTRKTAVAAPAKKTKVKSDAVVDKMIDDVVKSKAKVTSVASKHKLPSATSSHRPERSDNEADPREMARKLVARGNMPSSSSKRLPSRSSSRQRDIILTLARHPELNDDGHWSTDYSEMEFDSDFTSSSSEYDYSGRGSGSESDSFATALRRAAEHRKSTLESALSDQSGSHSHDSGSNNNNDDAHGAGGSSSGGRNDDSDGDGQSKPSSKDDSSSKPTESHIKAIVPHGSNAPKLSSVIVLPSSSRPLFPGLYYPTVVRDPQLVKDILALTKKGLPYVGVFMRKGHSLDSFMKNKTTIQSSEKNHPSIENPIYHDDEGNKVDIDTIHRVGTFAQIFRATPIENGALNVILVGLRRLEITSPRQTQPYLIADVKHIDEYNRFNRVYTPDGFLKTPAEIAADEDAIRAYSTEIMVTLKEIIKSSHIFSEQLGFLMNNVDWSNPSTLADICATMTTAEPDQLQEILSTYDVVKRLHATLTLLKKELQLSKLQRDIQKKVEETLSKNQREFLLKEQLKNIKRELGYEKDDKEALQSKFRSRLEGKTIPDDIKTVIDDELNKLASLEGTSMEFNITRNYLDWLTSIPWGIQTPENYDVQNAETILNEDHYGMQDVKDRILEFVSVGKLLESTSQGKIMLFVGPPGVGKTSIGKSIAKALNRPFYRFSVGGLGDVSEIKGHRRTYVGAMPGKIVQALKKAACVNPVVLIDEIDKIGRSSHHGDPSSALLEVLDPEQNNSFMDHYLDVPVDLSKVLFLCTANTLDTIPGPLLDRMDVVRLSGYVQEEKEHIAKHYLEPTLRTKCGVGDRGRIDPNAISHLIKWYSREAGVRNLQKFMEQIYRKIAFRIVRGDATPIHVTTSNLSDFVGQEIFTHERLYPRTPVGVVMGLAWSNSGGSVLYLESAVSNAVLEQTYLGKQQQNGTTTVDVSNAKDAEIISETSTATTKTPKKSDKKADSTVIKTPPPGAVVTEDGKTNDDDKKEDRDFGTLKVTGQLGDVMKESTSIAYTLAKVYLHRLHRDEYLMKSQGASPLAESDKPIDPYHCVQPELRPPVKNTTSQYSKALDKDATLFDRLQKVRDDPLDELMGVTAVDAALQPPPNTKYIDPVTKKIQPTYIPITDHNFFATHHIHIHVPQGSIPKDGPSAGVALVSSLLSQALNRPLVRDLAMTGEVTLTGKVLPIGGLKEKTIAARRAGVMHIMAPKANMKDFAELPLYITSEMTVYFPDTIDEVIRIVFGAPYALGGKEAPPTAVKKYPKFDGNIEAELLKDEQRDREAAGKQKKSSKSSSAAKESSSESSTKSKSTKRKTKADEPTSLSEETSLDTSGITPTKPTKKASSRSKAKSSESLLVSTDEFFESTEPPVNKTKKSTTTRKAALTTAASSADKSDEAPHPEDQPKTKTRATRRAPKTTQDPNQQQSDEHVDPVAVPIDKPSPESSLGKLRAEQKKRAEEITSGTAAEISAHSDLIKQIVSAIVDDPILRRRAGTAEPLNGRRKRGRPRKSETIQVTTSSSDDIHIPEADILFESFDILDGANEPELTIPKKSKAATTRKRSASKTTKARTLKKNEE